MILIFFPSITRIEFRKEAKKKQLAAIFFMFFFFIFTIQNNEFQIILLKYYIIGKMKSRQRGGGLIRLVCYVDIAIAIMKKVCKQFPKEEGRKFWPLHKTKDLSWKKIIVVVVILLSETSQNQIIYMFIVLRKYS